MRHADLHHALAQGISRTPDGLAARLWRLARRFLGVICLGLGLLGALLPLVPGLPFALLAVLLLGRRDPWLRRSVLGCRHILRRLRRVRQPALRRAACALSRVSGRLWRQLVAGMARGEQWWETRRAA